MLLLASSALFLRPLIVQSSTFLLPSRYQTYDIDTNYEANPLVQLIPILIPLYCLYSSKTEEDGKFSNSISMMYLFASLNIFFMSLIQSNNQIGRLAFYFVNCYTILIPYSISSRSYRIDSSIIYIIIILCFLYFFLSVSGGTLSIDNYKFFWQW